MGWKILFLGLIGGLPAKAVLAPTLIVAVLVYFGYLLVVQPGLDRLENFLGRHR